MSTMIELDEQLLQKVEKIAAEQGKTLIAVVEMALQEIVAREQNRPRERVHLPTFRGTGLQPGVNLDDSASLLDRMERGHAAL